MVDALGKRDRVWIEELISNAIHSFFLMLVLTALLTGSVVEAVSYQKTDGTIVHPILNGADLHNANLCHAILSGAVLSKSHLH